MPKRLRERDRCNAQTICKLLGIWILGSALPITSCGPHFTPNYRPADDCLSDLASAPIIVVAAIGANAVIPVSKPFETEQVPEGPIQLLKVNISIENVLKGDARIGRTAFFYFQRITSTGPSLMGFRSPASFRDILLLRKEQGNLRLLRDVRSNCAPAVFSGAHRAFKPISGESLRKQTVDVLLTPGEGATEAGMLQAVFERAPFQISPKDTLVKLLDLAASEPPLIRTAACLEFRDLMADLSVADREEALDVSAEMGISQSEVERWRRQKDQNGLAASWWARGPANGWLPSTSVPVNGPRGLALCTDDKALGVPSLHAGQSPGPALMRKAIKNLTRPRAPSQH